MSVRDLGERSFLRALSWGHVRQLESAARAFLAGLARTVPMLPGVEQVAYVGLLHRRSPVMPVGAG